MCVSNRNQLSLCAEAIGCRLPVRAVTLDIVNVSLSKQTRAALFIDVQRECMILEPLSAFQQPLPILPILLISWLICRRQHFYGVPLVTTLLVNGNGNLVYHTIMAVCTVKLHE